MDTDMHEIYKNELVINSDAKVLIGDKVWIGANTFVTKGTCVSDNVIIGANTITSKELKSGSMYIGNPSKPIKRFDKWKKYEKYRYINISLCSKLWCATTGIVNDRILAETWL